MRPHDLVRIAPGAKLRADAVPGWVTDALARAPWVVVRRAASTTGGIAIGVRGTLRTQRFAAGLDANDAAAVVTPEDLSTCAPQRDLPVFRTLPAVADAARAMHITWGPGGSVGFELASGVPTATPASDLDVILRPQPHHGREALAAFAENVRDLPARVDAYLETDAGAVALAEWLASDTVLIKTADGPRLGRFTW